MPKSSDWGTQQLSEFLASIAAFRDRLRTVALDRRERVLVSNMGRVLGLVLRMLRTLEAEREAAAHLRERQLLLERLLKIQRSISHRAPLQEVFDTITEGIRVLTGDEVSGLKLLDPEDPGFVWVMSSSGLSPQMDEQVRRIPLGTGARGRAVLEGRLVVIENYSAADNTVEELAGEGIQSAMGAPVYQDGEIAGSLVTATYRSGRVYTESDTHFLRLSAESSES